MQAVVRDSAGVVIQEFPAEATRTPAPFRLASQPEVSIGLLEGAPEYLWTRPTAGVRLADGGFAVAETSPAEIRVYDTSGAFVRRIGRSGDGPGEFRTPSAMTVLPGDTLVVWDARLQRLTWVTSEGVLVRDAQVVQPGGIQAIRRVTPSSGGTTFVLGSAVPRGDLENRGPVRESWSVIPMDPSGQADASLGEVPGSERDVAVQRTGPGVDGIVSIQVRGRWWWGEGFAWPSAEGVWTADRLALEARHFTTRSGLEQVVRVARQPRAFTPELIDSIHEVELSRADDPDLRRAIQDDFVGREYPATVPPLEAVFADAAGRLWLGLLEPPPGRIPSQLLPSVRTWLLFEAEGSDLPTAVLGTLDLPPASHPLWADGTGVLLLRADAEFDVAYVEWYPFEAH
ncbi:MAG: 6-bladed beta-propeller [Gemmatimonadota bacterium]